MLREKIKFMRLKMSFMLNVYQVSAGCICQPSNLPRSASNVFFSHSSERSLCLQKEVAQPTSLLFSSSSFLSHISQFYNSWGRQINKFLLHVRIFKESLHMFSVFPFFFFSSIPLDLASVVMIFISVINSKTWNIIYFTEISRKRTVLN